MAKVPSDQSSEPHTIFDDWRENIEKILHDKSKRLSGESKRCPKCNELSLEFDVKAGRIFCTKCGYQDYLFQ
ncbi:MAG TPA: hypothetical protein VJH22_03150 [Candidatus Nanoarchaeia archaeon]|nr:hypothetical protein [Candidatus Nanoarchaeia archaeon]